MFFFALHRDTKGATLIEALGFLTVAILIVVGVLALWNNATSMASESQARQEIMALQNGIQSLYEGTPEYSGLDNDLVIQAEIVPTTLKVSGSTIKNRWNGNVTVAEGGTSFEYSIKYDGVPERSCLRLASMNQTFRTVKVGSKALKNNSTMDDVSSACSSNNNSLEFIGS